jgi:phage replication initiation protein
MMANEDWGQRLKDFIEKIEGEITRVDPATDIFDGSYSVEQSKEDHLKGLFKLKNAPHNPTGESRGCWDYKELGIKNKGLSYYIGERTSSKYLRVYQKGFEQGKRLESSKEYGEFFERELKDWVRIEAEFKNSDRAIPTDILINPAQYLAGFAPALEFLSAEQSVINRHSAPPSLRI